MRNLISLLGLAVIVGAGYFGVAHYISVAHGQSSLLTPDQSISDISADAAQVLTLLNRLQAINLAGDSKVLTNQAFQSLQDWTVVIPEQSIGRANPYLPSFGTVSAGTSAAVKLPLPKSK